MRANLLAMVGAAVGGLVGYGLVFWLLDRGLLGLALPGGLLGVGAGVVVNRGRWVALVCGIAALVLGLTADYQSLAKPPAVADYLMGLPSRSVVTLAMLAVGTALGFYIPFSRYRAGDAGSAGRRVSA